MVGTNAVVRRITKDLTPVAVVAVTLVVVMVTSVVVDMVAAEIIKVVQVLHHLKLLIMQLSMRTVLMSKKNVAIAQELLDLLWKMQDLI